MKIIGALYCCTADQNCLTPFIESFQQINPDIELFIMSDIDSPVDHSTIPVRPGHWHKDGRPISSGVRADLTTLAEEHHADWIVKLDVDCIHLNNHWREGIGDTGIHAVGIAHTFLRDALLGACYALSRQALINLSDIPETNVVAEDIGMSKLLWEAIGKKSMKIHKNLIYGIGKNDIEPERFRAGDIIHCGELNIGKPDARIKCAEKMHELYKHFSKKQITLKK